MDDFEIYEFQMETTSRYNHSTYLNLLKSCKSYGYKKQSKGKPSYHELYTYIYANIGKREQVPVRIPIKYNTTYYFSLVDLAQWNGYIFQKVGKVSIATLQDFLDENGISYPERPVENIRNKLDISLYLQ